MNPEEITNDIVTPGEADRFIRAFHGEEGLLKAARQLGFTSTTMFTAVMEKVTHPDPKVSLSATKQLWGMIQDMRKLNQALPTARRTRTIERTRTDEHGTKYIDRIEEDFLDDFAAGGHEPPAQEAPRPGLDGDGSEDPASGGDGS